jgi:uncharacterized protein (TIGR00251 family)
VSAAPPDGPRGTPGLSAAPDGAAVLLEVRVQPGARASGPRGSWNGALKLAVAAPPEDGRANAAAAALLAELFGLRPSAVTLVRGHSSRSKMFRLELSLARARARLAVLLSASDGGAR